MYDYRKHLIQDIKDYIWLNNIHPEQDESISDYIDRLTDMLWNVDEVTGGGPYFYADEEECANYVGHGLYELIEAFDAFGYDFFDFRSNENFRRAPARFLDSIIRTYLLYECIEKAVEELGYSTVEE